MVGLGSAVGLVVIPLLAVGPDLARASVCVTKGARSPVLRVNASGTAEVQWTAGGERRYAVIRPEALCAERGIRMSGRDVSRSVGGVSIPFKEVVKRTGDGRLWALQAWRRDLDSARELRFSRWRGSPPNLKARTVCCRLGREVLRGRVTYHRKAVARATVYVDCLACSSQRRGWTRVAREKTSGGGRFRLVIRPRWKSTRYRVTLLGPNFGWVRAPDMRTFTRSALDRARGWGV